MQPLNFHSVDQANDAILDTIAPHLWSLSIDEQVAIAIAALYEAYEPDGILFDYECCPSRRYDQCIELIQLLSKPGKLALGRAIFEHLAVVEMAGTRDEISRSDNFCTFIALLKAEV